jgi:nidogen (entactin)
LTFNSEYPEFLNIQFPIEHPSISPFYSNIDISLGDPSTRITYYQTSTDQNLLMRASNVIRSAYTDASSFQAKHLLVATWSNVPKWRSNENRNERSYERNTFQVAIISSAEETYVEYLYPQGGLQWVQAETGDSGLPDIRARAGFVLTDGRNFELKGSGTDKVRHLTETSNYGQPGRWLYRIGKLTDDENLKEPDNVPAQPEDSNPTNCANGGRFSCHSSATCQDNSNGYGFICKCKDGYYGNGYSCIKNSVPIRVTGSVTGHIGTDQIQSQVQSYIVTSDGKSYTALSSIGSEIGTKLQLLQVIGGVIGWVFAKPVGSILNGYQITGGKFNHSSNIRFDSGENLQITQRYTGLNLWDQLAVEIEISGDVPNIHEGVKVTMEDFFEEFSLSSSDTISVVSNHRAQLSSGEPDISYTIYQTVRSFSFVI